MNANPIQPTTTGHAHSQPTVPHNVLTRSTSMRQLTATESALCGATAGLISRAIVSPLDVVKITLQLETARNTPHTVTSCASRIMRTEGMRGFFKGNLSAEYLYLTYGAMQFLAFGAVDRALQNRVPKRIRSFVGGALAGATATCVTYPLDLLRTRFVAQQLEFRVHATLREAVTKIYRDEGVRGFYRGLGPACVQIMPYMGIVFTSYDVLASSYVWARKRVPVSPRVLSAVDSVKDAVIGACAAVVGKTCVYPLDLVRKRLQIQGPHLLSYARGHVPKYRGMSDALVYIARTEGVLALFRGLTPALLKAAPASATVFFVFGHSRDLLLSLRPE
ncbi:mitochondrial thiamine pyrophosphate transporter [Coemansia sp. RSA 1807]|nr:mitochondrial thiamine pyrophosphate transporter [Coemansia sp. RSA 921]KAJ2280682.1 mitochondrial thiamine pyrophosphate transporter [Coemansia sp. RSA 451]KAJ2419283.1 mitochondrial thiamine pyrophosphate transporter [Coemansia sp. RSA 2524]KAJ2575889.1 mitochondrial thiamine pyrophosphate transporter [Coemansia sp. RSA 1807]